MDKTKNFVTDLLSTDEGKKVVSDINTMSDMEYDVFLDFMRFAVPKVLSGQDPQQVFKSWKGQEAQA